MARAVIVRIVTADKTCLVGPGTVDNGKEEAPLIRAQFVVTPPPSASYASMHLKSSLDA